MMKRLGLFLIGFLAVLDTATAAGQLSMGSRLGIGYKNQFSEDLPSLAVQYYPSDDLAISASVGVDTKEDDSKFGFMLRLNKVVFPEEHMNFYMGAGAGLLSTENAAGQNESGFELATFIGTEFFFAGLDNLGFSVESGVAVTSLSSGVRFRTFGDTPIRAGAFFYF